MITLAILVAALHSTTPGRTALPHPIPVVTIVAGDYYFQAPSTVTAGWVTLRFLNRGRELHMLGVTRLDNGHAINELLTILVQGKPAPEWAVDVGGPNAVSPGETSNATLRLEVGRYMLGCWITDARGRLHVFKGMVSPLEVTPARESTRSVPPPRPDVVASLADYHITLSPPLTRGRHVIEVENNGPHEHDLTVLRLTTGVSEAQTLDWFDNPTRTPPAATALGGVVGFMPGDHQFFTLDVAPGRYLLLCFVPDDSGRPHYRHGMFSPVTVR